MPEVDSLQGHWLSSPHAIDDLGGDVLLPPSLEWTNHGQQ
jgi:hypothetical protein